MHTEIDKSINININTIIFLSISIFYILEYKMEGFLPLVFKTIKKRKTRKQYECLSSWADLSHNMNMFNYYYTQQPSTSTQKVLHDHVECVGYVQYDSYREQSVS